MCDQYCPRHIAQCHGNQTYETGDHALNPHHHTYLEEIHLDPDSDVTASRLALCSWKNGIVFELGNHVCEWIIPRAAEDLKDLRKSEAGEPDKITVLCRFCNRAIDYAPVWDISRAMERVRR